VQTFVPYADFEESASVLDNKRLNKQLLEGRQILSILASKKTSGAWVNHPAVKMWRDCEMPLYDYLFAVKNECVSRGIQTEKNWNAIVEIHKDSLYSHSINKLPEWWEDERVHQSHRNNLYIKDPEYYAEFVNDDRVTCCERCNYFWPTHTLWYNLEMEKS
jgi:hypothetical protein